MDTGSLSDWQQQRTEDRAWQDQSNEGLKKPTKFEDIDRQEALEEEKINRETYHEIIAIRHGMDVSDMDAVYEKIAHDQARAEVSAQEWSEIAEHADTAVKIAENLKTTADYSVSALGAVTGPGLEDLLELKKQFPELHTVLHSDQGSVYASKAFNELLPMHNITHSMSRAGTPTDNAAMEAINGWVKAELFMDFHVTGIDMIEQEITDYITFFNEQRPAYALNYLTPKQYRESYFSNAHV